MRTRQIKVAGKNYTLTVKRRIIQKLNEVCPELLRLDHKDNVTDFDRDREIDAGIKLSANMDAIFYDMINIAHPEITKEKSDEIYESLLDEYADVEISLINFIKEVFTGGIPSENKKTLNW
jgi:hypothetical protein